MFVKVDVIANLFYSNIKSSKTWYFEVTTQYRLWRIFFLISSEILDIPSARYSVTYSPKLNKMYFKVFDNTDKISSSFQIFYSFVNNVILNYLGGVPSDQSKLIVTSRTELLCSPPLRQSISDVSFWFFYVWQHKKKAIY